MNENDIGRWRFLLTAIDSEGESVSDTLEIMVRQYPSSRLVNHQFNIEFAFKDWDPATTWAWEWVVSAGAAAKYIDWKCEPNARRRKFNRK